MFFHPKNLKSENNKPWFKPLFNILLHTQSIVCATVDSQFLEYLGYISLGRGQKLWKFADVLNGWSPAGDDENLAVITDVCSTLCKIYDTMSWTLLTLIIT